ncbi:ParB/RepB/Spo0J family partition protein [Actinomyces sp. F1_1611]
MAGKASGSSRRGGLGRGLGALIPTGQEEEVTKRERPLDVLFPDLQGKNRSGDEVVARGGSARDLLNPPKRATKGSNVSRETSASTKAASATPAPGKSAPAKSAPAKSAPAKSTKSKNVSRETSGDTELVDVPGASFGHIPLEAIVPNRKQPRQIFEQSDLDELAESIERVGLLQPIVVRPLALDQLDQATLAELRENHPEARYELIMGERRLRASELAGLTEIPAIVRNTEESSMLRDALLENLHRANLNPLEEAAAYAQLMADFACTQDELATKIARSRPQIANTLRLLKLPASIQQWVAAGVISSGHARALLGLATEAEMEAIGERIVQEGLSVRATEDLVRRKRELGEERVPQRSKQRTQSALALSVAERVSNLLDTQVTVSEGKKKGRIIIDFADADDLQRIVDLLGSRSE